MLGRLLKKSRTPIRWGDLRRSDPVSRIFGLDRGQPIDRVYIERFLDAHREDIRGRVLEIGDSTYTRQFGGDRVQRSDVVSADPSSRDVTIVADLRQANVLPANTFDCIICTQTLQFFAHPREVVAELARALSVNGVLLVTVPGISQISRYDMDRWGDYWRFTSRSLSDVMDGAFPGGEVTIESFGSVVTSVAFLHGLAAEELSADEFAIQDPDYQLLLASRAVRRSGS